MDKPKTNNSAKGKNSYDSELGGSLVSFFNRNVTPYPTEIGSVNFDLLPVFQDGKSVTGDGIGNVSLGVQLVGF